MFHDIPAGIRPERVYGTPEHQRAQLAKHSPVRRHVKAEDGAGPVLDPATARARRDEAYRRLWGCAERQSAPVVKVVAVDAPDAAPDGSQAAPVPFVAPTIDDIFVDDSNRLAINALRQLLDGTLIGCRLYLYSEYCCGKSLIAEVARGVLGSGSVLEGADNASEMVLRRLPYSALMIGRTSPADCTNGGFLGRAVVVEIGKPEAEIRRAVIEREFGSARVHASAVDYLIESDLNLGQIVGLIRSLAYLCGGPEITLDDVVAMEAKIAYRAAPSIRLEDIFREVCRHYDVSRNDLFSQRRAAKVMRPRLVAYYLAKSLTLRSLPEIARRMGGRDHTTALSGVRRVEKLIAGGDTKLAADVNEIIAKLEGGAR